MEQQKEDQPEAAGKTADLVSQRRFKLLRVTPSSLETAWRSSQFYRCMNWPIGATIAGSSYDVTIDQFVIILRCDDFEIVPDGECIPEITITFETARRKD